MVKETKRNYNLDILRIISMLMIITLHYCNFGYHIYKTGTVGNKTPILWLIFAFSYVAVNLYVLISGYFLSESKFKWKKVFKLIIEVLFYSIIIGAVFMIFKWRTFTSFRDILKVFLPVLSGTYWFISTYLVMYILSPYLNRFIKTMKEKEYRDFLIICGIIFIICNNIIPGSNMIDSTRGYGILWFMYLYFVAAYIRKYDFPKIKNIYYLGIYVIAILITFGSRYLFMNYLSSIDIFKENQTLLYSYNSITMFIASVSLFLFFKNIKMKEILPKGINNVAVATFGVYLIHENFLVREVLYDKVLKVTYFATKPFYVKASVMIASILAVFCACAIIDMIRKKIFDLIGLN